MDKRKRGNIFSSTAAMIQGNLDAFWRTPRTLLMMVFIACCCFLAVRGYATGLARKNYTMNMEESIAWFLMTGFNSFNLTSVTFLIMVSELPRRIPFQQYTLIRSTRVRWIAAQMLYCLLLVVLMLAVLIALTTLMLIPVVVQGKGWSDNVRIAAGEMPELSYVSAWIRQNLTPIQTSLLSIVPIFLFWLTMTWSILLCGLLGYGPQGVILYSVVLMLDTILMVDTPDFFLPKMWALFRLIVVSHPKQEWSAYIKMMCGYMLIDAALAGVLVVVAKRMEMPIYAANKN